MKHTLLLLFLSFLFIGSIAAQHGYGDCGTCISNGPSTERPDEGTADKTSETTLRSRIMVFPNPATDVISVTEEDAVSSLQVYNLVGRKLRTFNVSSGGRYPVSDLPPGIYMVQIVGKNNKVITTQRISRR